MGNLITRPIFHGSSPPPPTPGDVVIPVVVEGGHHQQAVGGDGGHQQQGVGVHGGDGNSPPGIRKIIRDVLIDLNEGLARNPVQGIVGIHFLDYMYKNEGVVATLLKITYGIGCGAVMVGARLKDAWPGLAIRVQELATVAFLVFICGSISSYLPFYLGLIAWLAWAATVIAVHIAFSDH